MDLMIDGSKEEGKVTHVPLLIVYLHALSRGGQKLLGWAIFMFRYADYL